MRSQISSVFILSLCVAGLARAADKLPPDEQAFMDKHLSEVIAVTPKRLTDPAITKTFSSPLYELTVTINMGDGGSQTQQQIAARVGDKLIPIVQPSTDGNCPELLKMVNPAFKLTADADAKLMQGALDVLFPPITDSSKSAITFNHVKNEWHFIRGAFFEKKLGFVVITDDKGKIISVKFSLQLS